MGRKERKLINLKFKFIKAYKFGRIIEPTGMVVTAKVKM